MNSSNRKDKKSKFSIVILVIVMVCLLITSFLGQAVNAQPAQGDVIGDFPFSRTMLKQSLEDTLDKLEEVYVYPDKVPAIRKEIMRRLNSGSYNTISNNVEFAEMIGSELRKVSGDMHLSLMVNPQDSRPLTPVLPAATEMVRNNFAFQYLEILEGNVGLLKFNKFDAHPDTQTVVDHAIGFLARSDALIIDLRDCIGGSPQLVRYLISHFLEQETLLWTAISQGKEQAPVYSLVDIGPPRFKQNYPVFILTSPHTTSAAEVFTVIMQERANATIVGERTPGISHAVSAFIINDYLIGRFSVVSLSFPFDLDGIEGQGVTPDMKASEDNSLSVAHGRAMNVLGR